jgi:oligopeptide transport system substrate-binding protein
MKKRTTKFIAALLILVITVGGLSACSSKSTNDSGTSGNAADNGSTNNDNGDKTSSTNGENTLDEDQTLYLLYNEPLTLDVSDVRNSSEFQILSQVQEGLFRTFTDEQGNDAITNAGAESYEVSEDGLVYTFKLRDYQWSDGVPVTAGQYVDSIIRLLDPEKAFSYSFMAYDILNAEKYFNGEVGADQVGVKALDDKTLEITLSAKTPYFIKKLTNVCFYPVRLDVIEKGSETYATNINEQVYSGPFVISDWVKANSMVLTKNPKYWDADNVVLQKVVFTAAEEPATQSLLIESKQLDAVDGSSEYVNKWKSLADAGQLVYITRTQPSLNFIGFNQHNGGISGLMNNSKIRLALSLAIDREEFNELIYDGINIPAYGLIPNNLLVNETEFRSVVSEPLKSLADEYLNQPDKLKALFIEGLQEEGKDTDLSKVNLTFITTGTTVQEKSVQEYYKQKWEDLLGIKITINVYPDRSTFVTERNNNNYDLLSNGWFGDYNDPMTFIDLWISDSGYAKFFGGYHNEEYDVLFNSLASTSEEEKRIDIYKALENNLIAVNSGVAPLYYTNKQIFIQSYVKNLSTPLFGTSYEFSRAYISGR